MDIEPALFSRLPDNIIHLICIYTGKFILRYDNKLRKTILVSIIDLSDNLWITFNKNIRLRYINKYNPYLQKYLQEKYYVTISRTGDLSAHWVVRVEDNYRATSHLMHKYMNGNNEQQKSKKYNKKRK